MVKEDWENNNEDELTEKAELKKVDFLAVGEAISCPTSGLRDGTSTTRDS